MDTIKLGIFTRLPASFEMRKDGFTQKNNYFYKNVEADYCSVALQASNHFDNHWFSVRFSAPKLMYGSNVEMLKVDDLWLALDKINEIVEGETRIAFNAHAAQVRELHLCHNWKLKHDQEVHAYVEEMKRLTYPYKHRDIHAKGHGVDTVYWRNKVEEILFYPKHAETLRLSKLGKVSPKCLTKSEGMLRWEHRLLKHRKVKAFAAQYGCDTTSGTFLRHLSEMTLETLSFDLQVLGLDKAIEVTGEQERAWRLKEYCGDNTEKFQSLLGFIHGCDLVGIDSLVPLGLINSATFRRRKAEIVKAGVSFTKPTKSKLLPPLPALRSYESTSNIGFKKTDIFAVERKPTGALMS